VAAISSSVARDDVLERLERREEPAPDPVLEVEPRVLIVPSSLAMGIAVDAMVDDVLFDGLRCGKM
jgi:hypothetical protein